MKRNFVFDIDDFVKDFNFDLILQESQQVEYRDVFTPENIAIAVGKTYKSDKKWFEETSNWQSSPAWSGQETMRLCNYLANILEVDPEFLNPAFLKLYKGEELRWHTDKSTLIGINFVLKGNDTPIEFKKYPDPIYYTSAIINTQEMHRVPFTQNEDRILLKMRIPRTSDLFPFACSYNYVITQFHKKRLTLK